MKRNLLLTIIVLFVIAIGAGAAQRPKPARAFPSEELRPCLSPSTATLSAPIGISPPAPDSLEFPAGMSVNGSVWNQTIQKPFGHTFKLPPVLQKCCGRKSVRLWVTMKALSPGVSGKSGDDVVSLVSGTVPKSSQVVWGSGAMTSGTLLINVPSAVFNTGKVSFFVGEDTAVVSAKLEVDTCCSVCDGT